MMGVRGGVGGTWWGRSGEEVAGGVERGYLEKIEAGSGSRFTGGPRRLLFNV